MMIIFIVIYLIVTHEIQSSQTLECYSCSGGQECSKLFSPKSANIKTIKSVKNDTFSSCSISVTPEGLTTRDLIPSYKCRSSSYEFCCNEDLCNNLASPPLPALTSLKCNIGKCSISSGICVYDAPHVAVLSSATESCSVTFGKENYKYYKKGCQPTIREAHATAKTYSSNIQSIFCCNSPECNTGHIGDAIKGAAIQCYTCDSRVTGLAGCMIINESSPHVYKAGSSSNGESCAVSNLKESICSYIEFNINKTIIGLEGRDPLTGITYPAFTIRTFISKCVNQPFGRVSYGGAYFKGRIECCSTHLCNTQTLNPTKDKPKTRLKKNIIIMIGIVIVVALFILVAAVIGWAVYRCRQKNDNRNYDPCSTNEPPISIELLKDNIKKQPSKQPTVGLYPEPHAAP